MGNRVGLVVVTALVAASAILVWRLAGDRQDEPGPTPVPSQPSWVRVVVGPTLRSGQRFDIRFEPAEGIDDERLLPPTALKLWKGDRTLNTLVAVDGPDGIQSPTQANLPLVMLTGSGPFTFTLPRLEPGSYVICGGITLAEAETPGGRFCRPIDVAA